jgi:hypothetical protein
LLVLNPLDSPFVQLIIITLPAAAAAVGGGGRLVNFIVIKRNNLYSFS